MLHGIACDHRQLYKVNPLRKTPLVRIEIGECFIFTPPDVAVQCWLKSEVLDMKMHYLQQANSTKVIRMLITCCIHSLNKNVQSVFF